MHRAACLCVLAAACYSPDLHVRGDAAGVVDAGAADAMVDADAVPPPDVAPPPDARRFDAAPCVKSGCTTIDCGDGVCRVRCLTPELTWISAEDDCRSWGGRLTTIPNASVNGCLTTTVSLWIGLNDISIEDQFEWADGTPLGSFTQWNSGEPDNQQGTEVVESDCVRILSSSGDWSDEGCNGSRDYGYVCERR